LLKVFYHYALAKKIIENKIFTEEKQKIKIIKMKERKNLT